MFRPRCRKDFHLPNKFNHDLGGTMSTGGESFGYDVQPASSSLSG